MLTSTALCSTIYYGNPVQDKISSQISRVHTPGCSYGSDPSVSNTTAPFPPLFLAECTEPIAPTAVDLRGWWKNPENPDAPGERIEQCGLRIIITGGGIIHDIYIADGTLNNGVVDVRFVDCYPLSAAGLFNKSANTFALYTEDVGLNPPLNVTPVVTRRLIDATTMEFKHPLLGTVNYNLVQAPAENSPVEAEAEATSAAVAQTPILLPLIATILINLLYLASNSYI